MSIFMKLRGTAPIRARYYKIETYFHGMFTKKAI